MKITYDDQLARRMQQQGILLNVDEDSDRRVLVDGLLIYQSGGFIESAAVDYRGVATVFTIHLVITVDRNHFAISGFELELPWKCQVRWLEDPCQRDDSNTYRFYKEGLPDYDRSEALNHIADVRRSIPRGRSLAGFLLGVGDEPIPDSFPHGATIPAFIQVTDQFFREYRRPIALWTDRMLVAPHSQRPRRSIFDRQDYQDYVEADGTSTRARPLRVGK